jgi:hypothetical protein
MLPPELQEIQKECLFRYSLLASAVGAPYLAPVTSTLARKESMLRTLKRDVAFRMVAVIMAAASVSGCTLDTDVTAPGSLIKVSGDRQTAPVNTPLPVLLTVAVVNQFGQTLQNVTVTWSIASGGGSLSSNTLLSDEGGLASVTYTTGPTAGQAIIKAQVHEVPALSFSILIV